MGRKNILDLLIPFRAYVSYRDFLSAIVLVVLVVLVIFLIAKRKKTGWERILVVSTLSFLGWAMLWIATASYKSIQMDFTNAEYYESIGNYRMAYSIYIDMRYELGEYQDLDERIERCFEKLKD